MCKLSLSSWSYSVVPETGKNIDAGEYHTYGIKVHGEGFSSFVHDVSVNYETVSSMAKLFNEHQLSPIHLENAIEDMIISQYSL